MFTKATRTAAKFKLAISGPSGSGKTKSALLFATGLVPGGKYAVVDTENESASLYADEFEFDTASITPPYTVDKFIAAIKYAEQQKYDVLIIDSISHAWRGDGGILAQKEKMDAAKPSANSFTHWAKLTPLQEKFVSTILNANIHIIVTMRSKQSYTLTEDDRGRKVPMKMGLAPVQRDDIEYEFTTTLDINMDHKATATKDRTPFFSIRDEPFQITADDGAKVREWLAMAPPPPPRPDTAARAGKPNQIAVIAPDDPFVMKMGSFKGRHFNDIPISDLKKALDWFNSLQNITQFQKTQASNIEEYLMNCLPPSPEPQKEPDDSIGTDQQSSS